MEPNPSLSLVRITDRNKSKKLSQSFVRLLTCVLLHSVRSEAIPEPIILIDGFRAGVQKAHDLGHGGPRAIIEPETSCIMLDDAGPYLPFSSDGRLLSSQKRHIHLPSSARQRAMSCSCGVPSKNSVLSVRSWNCDSVIVGSPV